MTDDILKRFEELENQLFILRQRLQAEHETTDAHVGQSWGQANLQWPHGTPVFPFREIHNLSRQSINSSFPVTFTVDYDEFVAKLHSAKLRVKFSNVRSNVSAASSAAGGGTTATSTSGGAQTSSSGGAQTSSGGSSHTHSISGQTISAPSATFSVSHPDLLSINNGGTGNTGAGTSHNHASATTDNTDTAVVGTNHGHTVSGGSGSESSHTHTGPSHNHGVTYSGNLLIPTTTHTHDYSATSTAAESSHTHTVVDHTHTVSNHTHDVTLSNHTHTITLTYGIFEQAYSNPGLRITINGVDRTAALGGPWNSDPAVLDITEYLRETSGEPIRGANTIVFSVSSSLLDIEATLKSVALPSNLLVAGL